MSRVVGAFCVVVEDAVLDTRPVRTIGACSNVAIAMERQNLRLIVQTVCMKRCTILTGLSHRAATS